MTYHRNQSSHHSRIMIQGDRNWPWYLTHAALILGISVVVARMITPDALRDPWDTTPGHPASHDAGPVTALVLDLLACMPALLVLLRRIVDSNFRLINRWSHTPLLLLGAWAVISTAWSADKFAAAISASHLLAFSCLLWAISQVVRSWDCFRLVAAVAFGMLLVLVAQAMIYKFVEAPATLELFNRTKPDILQSHHWTADSFAARQFELKLTSGELAGFFNSANSFAAVGVLLFAACVGIGVQKLLDRDKTEWVALPVIAAGAAIWILVSARSKTSIATPIIGVFVLGVFAIFRDRLRKHSVGAYSGGVAIVTLGLIAIVGHGVYHHGLFPGHLSNSLDFRWKYWVASAGMFAQHPIVGVGWDNFGLHYLAFRLPEASEEIKDPHNFLVRFFVELGTVGGLLAIAWLMLLARELTRPAIKAIPIFQDQSDPQTLTVISPVVISILGIGLGTIATTDFGQPLLDTITLLLKPVLYFLAMALGSIGASMLSPHSWKLDSRPAPWIYYCTVTGLGLFLLHNLIDFSWFEPGAMGMFMLLIASVLGMAPARAGRPVSRLWPIVGTITFGLLLLSASVFFVAPIAQGEELARESDDTIAAAPADRSPQAAAAYHLAAGQLSAAVAVVPYNADYLVRLAKALWSSGDVAGAQAAARRAQSVNPFYIDAFLIDANMQLVGGTPDVPRARADFETAMMLNPNDVSLHQQYAETLDRLGLHSAALTQYLLAIAVNNALPVGEPKRLSSEQLTDLKGRIQRDRN